MPGRPKRSEAVCGDLHRALREVHDPMGLVRAYLASRGLLSGPSGWVDDLVDVGLSAVVDAALSWDPDRYESVMPYVYGYLRRDVDRAIGRQSRQRAELGVERCVTADPDRWTYRPQTSEFATVELRVDLQRWADLAGLSPKMRWAVERYAVHAGARSRAVPGEAAVTARMHAACGPAFKYLRRAAVTGERREDRWVRAREIRDAA